ncbi:hypothetical protein AB0M45_27925 [Nocardia sp. NPDC051787]|uniref:hypothetical protein n=1 Tax=Nocardia sp. NPDC051787 TaxID=3155415 RepID=UPI0034252C34
MRQQGQLLAGSAASEHAVDDADVDDLDVQGAATGVIDGVGAVAAHQPEQPVDLPHLRPGQWMLEHRRRISTDMRAIGFCIAVVRDRLEQDRRRSVARADAGQWLPGSHPSGSIQGFG